MSAALLCPRSRTQNERAFELRSQRVRHLHRHALRDAFNDVGFGSWLCENAKTLNRDRRSYSSKTVLVAQRASGFNLEIELKNIILRRVSIFEFLHSQGQLRNSAHPGARSALLLSTDIARATRPLIQMSEFSARVRPPDR